MQQTTAHPHHAHSHRKEWLAPGLRVGLLGGSFNPAHEGHLHVSRMCIRALGLDRLWWLVSPQNPLKSSRDMAPLDERMASAQAMARDHRICVTDIETRLGTRYTFDTVSALTTRHPDVNFIWLMGADNMIQFPRWQRWRELANLVPIAVYPRPGYSLKARLSPAAMTLRASTLEISDAKLLSRLTPPALLFLEGRESALSATSIREARLWPL